MIYLVTRITPTHYDEYSDFVISAPSAARALEIAIKHTQDGYGGTGDFTDATVTLIEWGEDEGIILGSFHAG